MSAHTPGPWAVKNLEPSTIGHEWVDGPDRRCVAVCSEILGNGPHGYCYGVDADEIAANARLIAAAPDLLEALIEAAIQIEYLHEKFKPTGSGEAVLAKINAAIARAKGETT